MKNYLCEVVNIFLGAALTSIAAVFIYSTKQILYNTLQVFKEQKMLRFSQIYNDRLLVLKEMYYRLTIAEKSLTSLMQPLRSKETEELEIGAKYATVSLFEYFDKNEILFDAVSTSLIVSLRKLFDESLNSHSKVTNLEEFRSSAWVKAIEKKSEVFESIVSKKIPEIKLKLKQEFQKQLFD